MELKEFVQRLNKLSEKYGDDTEVIMADNMPVVNPIYSNNYPSKSSIVITDTKQSKSIVQPMKNYKPVISK